MAKKISVVPNESLVGKLVTMLDGSRDKIVEVSARSYKMRDRRKALPATCLAREGQTFFEVTAESVAEASDKVKVRDGYVVMPKVEEKKPTRGNKKADAVTPKTTRGGKKTAVEVDQSDDDDFEEETKPMKKTAVAKMVVTSLIEQSSELRKKIEGLLHQVLSENFENFVSVGAGATVEDPNVEGYLNNRFYVTADIQFDIPEEEVLDEEELDEEAEAFEFSEETLGRVVDGLWQKQVEKQAPIVMKVYEALQLETDEERESFTIGSRLVDEDDRVFYFAGLQRDPAPRLIVESEDGETLDFGSKDFVSLEFKPVIAEEYEEELEEVDELDELDEEVEADEVEESEDDSILAGCATREEAQEVLEELTEKQLRAFIYENMNLGEEGTDEYEANASYVDESDSEELIEFILSAFYDSSDEEESDDESEEDEVEEESDEDEVEEVEEESDDEFSYSEEESDDEFEEEEEEEEEEPSLTEADVFAMNPQQIVELLDEHEIAFNAKMRNVKMLKAERVTFNKFKGWAVKQLKAAQVL